MVGSSTHDFAALVYMTLGTPEANAECDYKLKFSIVLERRGMATEQTDFLTLGPEKIGLEMKIEQAEGR